MNATQRGGLFSVSQRATFAATEDLDTGLVLDTDGEASLAAGGTKIATASSTGLSVASGILDLNGTADALVLDADGDTSISSPTDDQIDVECGGVDAVTINASGLQVAGVAVTATTGGGTTGLIPSGARFVTVTSDSADKQITLPANVVGHVIEGMVNANGCEMICADAAAKINDVTCGATNEAAIPADTSFRCVCISSTEWILTAVTKLGAVVTAIVPDAL